MASNSYSPFVPKMVKNIIKSHLNPVKFYGKNWEKKYNDIISNANKCEINSKYLVYIINDVMKRHAYYEAACIELGINYEVVDVGSSDWVKNVDFNRPDVVFVRPFVLCNYGKKYYDEIVNVIANRNEYNLYPNKLDLWIYESKTRCAYELVKNNIHHPETYIFNNYEKAISFVENAKFPLIFKTDIGSDASGVKLVNNVRSAKHLVRQCFSKGFTNYFYDTNEKQLGLIIFQEYIHNAREIRVIRIGNSYFVYEKGKKGNFHSGSKIVYFIEPSIELLEFVRNVTDKIGTECMSVDVFQNESGDYLVNELQTYYGANEPGGIYFENEEQIFLEPGQTHEMRINGRNGRYYFDNGEWRFEEGDFARNAGCNLRVIHAFQKLGIDLANYRV